MSSAHAQRILIVDNVEDSLYCENYYNKDTENIIIFAPEKNITGKNISLDSIYLKTWKCLELSLCKLENDYLGAMTIVVDSLGKVRGAILTQQNGDHKDIARIAFHLLKSEEYVPAFYRKPITFFFPFVIRKRSYKELKESIDRINEKYSEKKI